MPGLLSAIGPIGLRGPLAPAVMGSAARLMGNLVTPDDRDLTARLWLGAGRLSNHVDRIFRQDARPLFG
ncbi:MAG: FAD-linked oxidoreductase, partial [Candidatus Corynebacterium faecigallinarum]